ncbi:MAG: hypothetical protein A2068_09705 [Ignavibacteria bacterium GWB2_35_6b]|nr:MAG: hypothetical protein A2068_09705 [Ignavibacteria bacterium GWB2_35_6b]
MKLVDLNYGENYKQEIDLKHYLENKLAESLGIPNNQILLNYGCNSNLLLFVSTFAELTLFKKKRRVKILLDVPNYFFTLTQLKQWHVDQISIQRDEEFNLPFEQFISQIKKTKPDIVIVTTPNNPTGKPVTDEQIDKIIKTVSKETIVFIDRSCVNTVPEISSKEIFEKYTNRKIVIIRSYSKSHSLSDSRVGYMATNNLEIANLLRPKADLNHNLHALQKFKSVMNNNKMVEEKRKTLKECNKLVEEYFGKVKDAKYFKSYSNFAVIKLPPHLTSMYVEEYMKSKKVLVMGGHKIGLGENHIRIHMSSVAGIKKFINVFKTMI